MTTETRTATATEIADTLHAVLFGGRPDIAVTAWTHDGTDYVITDGTGESAEGVFVYEASDVADWLAECGENPDYSEDYCQSMSVVEDEDVARALWRDRQLVALASGLCTPVIPAPEDIDGLEITEGVYVEATGLTWEEWDHGEVLAVHGDGTMEIGWEAGGPARVTSADGLVIIGSERLREFAERRIGRHVIEEGGYAVAVYPDQSSVWAGQDEWLLAKVDAGQSLVYVDGPCKEGDLLEIDEDGRATVAA